MTQSSEAIPNILLAALPAREYQKLMSALTSVTLPLGEVLYEKGKPILEVYFPSACLVSLLTKADAHQPLEVGMVGREGLVGVQLALGAELSPVRALVQGAGPALRMKKARFLHAMEDCPALRRGVYGYVNLLLEQISLSAVCNRFHVVEARLARWLLMTRDRVERADFRMTHEFLSHMLGVRREGVSEAAADLQHKNIIEYSRGKIHILNHRALEAEACSCYRRSPMITGVFKPWRPGRHEG